MERNPMLLERIVRNLGENISDRWDYDAEGRASGLIVDTPASFAVSKTSRKGPDRRPQLLKACVESLRSKLLVALSVGVELIGLLVNVILVVGHEKLNVEMQKMFGDRCTVVKVPKSGGVRLTL
jgi:polyribonucleotide 5'-hydroxyl-kinase